MCPRLLLQKRRKPCRQANWRNVTKNTKVLQKDYKNLQGRSAVLDCVAKNQEDTELGRLMHDLHCKNAEDMYSEILANRVRELKGTQKGVESMCREMDQIYSEGIASGEKKGRAEERRQIIQSFIEKGFDKDFVKSLGFSEEEYAQAEQSLLINA